MKSHKKCVIIIIIVNVTKKGNIQKPAQQFETPHRKIYICLNISICRM